MITIESLVEQGANVKLEVTPCLLYTSDAADD